MRALGRKSESVTSHAWQARAARLLAAGVLAGGLQAAGAEPKPSLSAEATTAQREALRERAEAALAASDWKKLLELLDELLLFQPNSVEVLTSRGYALSKLERRSEAAMSLETAISLAPNEPVALTLLCRSRILLGEQQEAKSSCSRASEISPSRFFPAVYVAHAHLLSGDEEAAKTLYDRAMFRTVFTEREVADVLSDFREFAQHGWDSGMLARISTWFAERAAKYIVLTDPIQDFHSEVETVGSKEDLPNETS